MYLWSVHLQDVQTKILSFIHSLFNSPRGERVPLGDLNNKKPLFLFGDTVVSTTLAALATSETRSLGNFL